MRIRDIIVEDANNDDGISSSNANLAGMLETIGKRAADLNQVPKVRVQSLVSMMKSLPGSEMFNIDTLIDAFSDDEVIKNLIKDIKSDNNGVKYIYLKPVDSESDYSVDVEVDDGGEMDTDTDLGMSNDTESDEMHPDDTIEQMSKRALKKRM